MSGNKSKDAGGGSMYKTEHLDRLRVKPNWRARDSKSGKKEDKALRDPIR